MAKIYLSPKEKQDIANNGAVEIERKSSIPAPPSSILHGVGKKSMWDKVARKWVYGDTDAYIEENKLVGRRGSEYPPPAMRNTTNGSQWFEFNKVTDEFGELGDVMRSGRKQPILFMIEAVTITELRQTPGGYLDIIHKIKIVKVN